MQSDVLYEYMARQLDTVPTKFHRYLYPSISWDDRMLGLVGPRGVGKTTLFLQRIIEQNDRVHTLYVSADHMFFAAHTLYEVADEFYKNGGKYLYIDEVHKYEDWSRELKMIYDSMPKLHVYFTGSSVLDIEKGEADLSRRAPKYLLQGLSFREFLAVRHGIDVPVHSLEQLLSHDIDLSGVEHPLPLFKEYLKTGYYPFGSDRDFEIELEQVITRTLEVDIPQYADMTIATGRKLKRLVAVVSTLVPFKPNMSDLARRVQVSRNNIEDYLAYLEKAGIIAQLRTGASGLGALGKVDKIYLDNTNILYNLSDGRPDTGTVRETFFFNQVRVNHSVSSSPVSDFLIEKDTFEVGGKSKGVDQVKGVPNAYIVKDDIEFGGGATIPLWAFGLLY